MVVIVAVDAVPAAIPVIVATALDPEIEPIATLPPVTVPAHVKRAS